MRGRRAQPGFTIIEVMLALGISGMMMVGILVSVGAGISGQRYKDSVNSVLDYFQGQYSEVANTRNLRTLDKTCDSTGIQDNPAADAYVGTTDCTIIGRLLKGNGNKIEAYTVYTTVDSPTPIASDTELTLLTKANPVVEDVPTDSYELEWGAKLVAAGSTAPQAFTIMIIRSPTNGGIYTFVDTTSSTTTIAQLIANPSALTSDAVLCVAPEIGFGAATATGLGVKILKNAADSSGVQPIGNGGGC